MTSRRADTWEPLHGEQPDTQLSLHPTRRFVARQVCTFSETTVERAAVWDVKTRRIIWKPRDARALCWTSDGDEILVIREAFHPDPASRGIAVTPLQSEVSYTFERRGWPSRELIAATPLVLPTGWPVAVAASPREPLACVVWRDQTEAGVELISWKEGPPRQLSRRGYFGRSAYLGGVTFSPDGRFFVLAYGIDGWWSGDPETPCPGGRRKLGWVVIGETARKKYRKIDITVTVKKGWLPDDPWSDQASLLPAPTFVDGQVFRLRTPTGEVLTHSVDNLLLPIFPSS